jgi:dTDP-4-dehydrorhamnose reductase
MTRYEFAQNYARLFKLNGTLIQSSLVPFPVDRKRDKDALQDFTFRLSVANIEEFLGTTMPTIEESLIFTKKRLEVFSEKSS